MQRKVNKRKAKEVARKLLKEFDFNTPPLNIFDLLSFIDLEFREFDPKDLNLKDTDPEKVSAFISYTENIVLYNKFHHEHRVRFSIAHEIGHAQLNHNSFPHAIDYDAKNPDELEANIFAAELLIPNFLVVEEEKSNLEEVKTLGDRYNVSFEAVLLRIRLDDTIVGSGYDFIGERSIVKQEFDDFDNNFYLKHYPPYEDFEDDFEEAYEHYSEYSEEDIKDLIEWIEENDEQNSFPEAHRALKKLFLEYSEVVLD